MYVVKNQQGDIVAYCSQHKDALAIASGASVDKQTYFIERL